MNNIYDNWPRIRRTQTMAIFAVLRALSSAPDGLAGPVQAILAEEQGNIGRRLKQSGMIWTRLGPS